MSPSGFGTLVATMGAELLHRRFNNAISAEDIGRHTRFIMNDRVCFERKEDAAFAFSGFGPGTNTAMLLVRESSEGMLRLYSYSEIVKEPDFIHLNTDWKYDFVRKSLNDETPNSIMKWNIGFLEKLAKEVGIGHERA